MPGLSLSNEFISRDEALHTEFAVLIYKKFAEKLDGSKAFNVNMRSIAKDKGYLLNEYGLFDLKTKRPVTFFTSEKQIFDYLGIEFKIPTERFSSDDCYLIEKCENDEK